MREISKIISLSMIIALILGCSDSSNNPVDAPPPITVDIRMEVQVLDITYQLYSRPFTRIYFTTYRLLPDGSVVDFSQSDTAACQNGWGVKELRFVMESEEEKIMLGAACEGYDGSNLRFEEINYDLAAYRADSNSYAHIIRTFAIYYN